MGNSMSKEDLESIGRNLGSSCEKLRNYINNLWEYIYNKDEKKHMQ